MERKVEQNIGCVDRIGGIAVGFLVFLIIRYYLGSNFIDSSSAFCLAMIAGISVGLSSMIVVSKLFQEK